MQGFLGQGRLGIPGGSLDSECSLEGIPSCLLCVAEWTQVSDHPVYAQVHWVAPVGLSPALLQNDTPLQLPVGLADSG